MSTGGRRWAPRSVRGELAEGLCRYDFKIRGGNSASADLGIVRGGGSAEPSATGNTTVRIPPVRIMLPLKIWKHGLSGGPQRQFKVDSDHPNLKDGHCILTQEDFG